MAEFIITAMVIEYKRNCILKNVKVVKDHERSELIRQLKDNQKERMRIPSGDEMDINYRRLKYTRYADDFLIGIIGSKQDAINIKTVGNNQATTKLYYLTIL